MKWICGLLLLTAWQAQAQPVLLSSGEEQKGLSFRQLQALAAAREHEIPDFRFGTNHQPAGLQVLFIIPPPAFLPAPAAMKHPTFPGNVEAGLQWTSESLPFFCRIEHDLGKKTRIPFKFRLGSVEYVDWMEGKPGCGDFAPYR